MWAEATLQFEEWRESFKSEAAVKRLVHEDYYFVSSIWSRNNVRYSGIHRLNERGEIIPRSGLNLDNFEWINVMKKVDDINEALYGIQASKGEKRRPQQVQVWTYMWCVNGKEVDGDEIHYFREDDARRFGQMEKSNLVKNMKLKKQDKLEMKVVPEFVERPSEVLQMRSVLHECMKAGLTIYREKKCAACQLEPPASGQKSHMSKGGCLEEDALTSDDIGFVMDVIQSEDLIAVYNTVCRFLGVSPSGSQLLAKGIKSWISVEEVGSAIADSMKDKPSFDEDGIKHEILFEDNQPLLRLIRDIYFDLNMQANLEKRFADKMVLKYTADKSDSK